MVWTPEVQVFATDAGDPGQLGIAFFEYLLQVPANRLGSAVYSAPQLKGMQEVITLLVFAGFSVWYLGQPLKWNHCAGFALIAVAAWLIFLE